MPRRALAYDEEVHTFLAKAALAGAGLDVAAEPIAPDAPLAVRTAIDLWARTSTDTALRAEWLRRYPTPELFDAWAMKELLQLSPAAEVLGIDRLPPPTATLLEVIETGARQPDDDRRNRDRFAYDAARKQLSGPADPAILNMGKLGALSSQAHAHYGLAQVELSSDPEVLKSDPRRFAVASGYPKGPVLTLGAEMAELHLDLALIAATLEQPSPTLAWLYTGHAFHYLQDVSNQIHTIQVGLYDFFVDATLQRLWMSAKTGGGYFGELRTMASIGIDMLTNHHVISEKLAKKRVIESLGGRSTHEGDLLVSAPKNDDPELAAALDRALAPWGARAFAEPFGEAMARVVIETSSHEGADVYRATRAIAQRRFSKAGVLFDEKSDDPDSAILDENDRDPEAYGRFFSLQERAFRRAGTAMRRWVALEKQAIEQSADPAERARLRSAAIERLVRRQLRALHEAELRRADYVANPPAEATGPERMPLMLAAEIALLLAAALLARRILKNNRSRPSSGRDQ